MSTSQKAKKYNPKHRSLIEFTIYTKKVLNRNLNNLLVLSNCPQNDCKNRVIIFCRNATLNNIFDSAILNIFEGLSVLDEVRRELGRPGLRYTSGRLKRLYRNAHYRDLQRIRNKLLAHRIENTLKYGTFDCEWYKKKFGGYKGLVDLELIHK